MKNVKKCLSIKPNEKMKSLIINHKIIEMTFMYLDFQESEASSNEPLAALLVQKII